MTINKALKAKARLVSQLNNIWEKITKYNSVLDGAEVPYNIMELYREYHSIAAELVELKTKIQLANGPILANIYKMSELKAIVVKLKALSTQSGLHDTYSDPKRYIASMDTVTKDRFISELEIQIDMMQSDIEEFNARTLLA